MSVIRFYADEDAGEAAVIFGLRVRGIDVLTTIEARHSGATDSEQLAFAVEQTRCLYTFNIRDFARLHEDYQRRNAGHYGIIVIPEQRYSIGEKIRKVAELARNFTADQMKNRLEFL